MIVALAAAAPPTVAAVTLLGADAQVATHLWFSFCGLLSGYGFGAVFRRVKHVP